MDFHFIFVKFQKRNWGHMLRSLLVGGENKRSIDIDQFDRNDNFHQTKHYSMDDDEIQKDNHHHHHNP